jgi:hypothetical protein
MVMATVNNRHYVKHKITRQEWLKVNNVRQNEPGFHKYIFNANEKPFTSKSRVL